MTGDNRMNTTPPPTPWPGANPNKSNPVERPWAEGVIGQTSREGPRFSSDTAINLLYELAESVVGPLEVNRAWTEAEYPESYCTAEEATSYFNCNYCGSPSIIDPSDQVMPADYCHESDHGC